MLVQRMQPALAAAVHHRRIVSQARQRAVRRQKLAVFAPLAQLVERSVEARDMIVQIDRGARKKT